ncbi:MAG: membrane protein insertion efficiency factor YidD [Gaiellales bacterium]
MISRLLIVMVRVVRLALTPFVAMTSITPRVCKYEPTCSHYAEQAIRTHGPVRGMLMAGWRVLRCNPWSRGGYDPVVRP